MPQMQSARNSQKLLQLALWSGRRVLVCCSHRNLPQEAYLSLLRTFASGTLLVWLYSVSHHSAVMTPVDVTKPATPAVPARQQIHSMMPPPARPKR